MKLPLTSPPALTPLPAPVLVIPPGARIALSRLFAAGAAAVLVLGRSNLVAPGGLADHGLFLAGLLLAAVAMAGRMWCSLFIAGRKNAELVHDGPYAMCRNPLYFFSLLGALGVALATASFTVMALVAVFFALYYPAVIRREEAYLLRRHGAAFAAYCQETPAFWPRRGAAAPEEWLCRPRVFLKHLGSAVWFPVICGICHLAPVLKAACGFSGFFSLP